MAVLDPNVLNPYVLLDPAVAPFLGVAITSISVAASLLISRCFFKSYTFSGFGYLLGLPVGFAFLGASFLFEMASVIYVANPVLHPAFFWIQMSLQSEALALIALSYYYKNSSDNQGRFMGRNVVATALPLMMVTIPFIVPTAALVAEPYFNYAGLADLSFYMRIFNVAVIAFIFRTTIVSLVRAANIKLLYVPAAFALLWLEQYSLIIAYFDNSVMAFVGSTAARLVGLGLFAYIMYSIASRRKMEIEARKAA